MTRSEVLVELNKLREYINRLCFSLEYINPEKLELPSVLKKYDPDPSARHNMSNQRRLDTAWECWNIEFNTKLKETLNSSFEDVLL